MDKARNKTTGEITLAEELKNLNNIDKYNYECPDPECRCSLTASSFEQHHKKRPYFTPSDRSKQHVEGCEFTVLENFYKKARSGKIKANEYIKSPSNYNINNKDENYCCSIVKILL